MDSRTVNLIISVVSRVFFGVVLGGVFALAGWFIAWFFFLRPNASLTEAMILFTVCTGVFGGIGAGIAWLRIDEGFRSNVPAFLMAIAGGLIGSVIGLAYANFVFDVDVARGEGDITAIPAAGITANLPLLGWSIISSLRKRAPVKSEPFRMPKRNSVPESDSARSHKS